MSRRIVFCLLAVVTLLAACSGSADRRAAEDEIEHARQQDFFKLPSPFPAGAPGTLIRHERLLGAPNGAIACVVLLVQPRLHE